MTSADQPPGPAEGGGSGAKSPNWPVTAAALAVVALAGGWFLWSWGAQHNPAGDAFGEALGVGFGLLVFGSAIGAVVSRRRGTD
ncbi:MAG TPA: hypothetical protein VGJ53_16355 [Micromonosporaceae bacterium]